MKGRSLENIASRISRFFAVVSGRSAAASVVQTFGFRIALLGMNLVTGIIVARVLAPQGRGEQAAMALWVLLVAGLSSFGLPAALAYYARRQAEMSERFLFAGTVFAVGDGIIAGAIGVLAMPYWLHGYGSAIVSEAQWLMIFTPQCLVMAVLRGYLQAKGEFTRYNLTLLCPSMMTIIVLVALAATGHLTAATAPFAYYVPGALQTAWTAGELRGRFAVGVRTLVADTKVLLSYGGRAFGYDVIVTLSTQIDQALIIGFLTPRALGLYTVALTASRVIGMVQQSVSMVLSPQASGLDEAAAIVLVTRTARLTGIFSVAFATVLMLALPIALPLVYGRAFAPAIPVTAILMVEAAIGAVSSGLMQVFGATGRPFISTLIQGIWLASAVLLLVILVPRMGLAGAAAALFVSTVIRLGVVLASYPIALKTSVPRLIPDRSDLQYLRSKLFSSRLAGRSIAGET